MLLSSLGRHPLQAKTSSVYLQEILKKKCFILLKLLTYWFLSWYSLENRTTAQNLGYFWLFYLLIFLNGITIDFQRSIFLPLICLLLLSSVLTFNDHVTSRIMEIIVGRSSCASRLSGYCSISLDILILSHSSSTNKLFCRETCKDSLIRNIFVRIFSNSELGLEINIIWFNGKKKLQHPYEVLINNNKLIIVIFLGMDEETWPVQSASKTLCLFYKV